MTHRFPTLQPAPQTMIVPVERSECQAHSGVCVEIMNIKADLVAIAGDVVELKADKGSMRAFWFALVAAAVGSGIGAAVSMFAR